MQATTSVHPIYEKAAAERERTGRHPWIDTADCAVLIRAALARRWPGTRFYVTSSRYAGGSSIRVAWDGVQIDPATGWAMRCRVNYDGEPIDWQPVTEPDYSTGRYGLLPKPDAPRQRDVEALLDGFSGKGFDGSIDLAYYRESWLDPDGTVTFAATDGTEGSRGYVPAAVTSRRHPSALLVQMGASYVFSEPELPFAQRERARKAARS